MASRTSGNVSATRNLLVIILPHPASPYFGGGADFSLSFWLYSRQHLTLTQFLPHCGGGQVGVQCHCRILAALGSDCCTGPSTFARSTHPIRQIQLEMGYSINVYPCEFEVQKFTMQALRCLTLEATIDNNSLHKASNHRLRSRASRRIKLPVVEIASSGSKDGLKDTNHFCESRLIMKRQATQGALCGLAAKSQEVYRTGKQAKRKEEK